MLDDRFWTKVDKDHPNGCWVWTANRNNKGYGMFRPGGLTPKRLAHRLSYEDAFGAIPRGGLILHSCDNRSCVNPSHLRVGNFKDNVKDMDDRGRRVRSGQKGEENKNSILTEADVIGIRVDYINGVGINEICQKYKISAHSLADYTSGRAWRHILDKGPSLEDLQQEARRRTRNSARLTADDASEIRALLEAGETGKSLAERFGVTAATISDIKMRRTWV